MPKDIKSHRNLSIHWNKQRNSLLLDLRPIAIKPTSFRIITLIHSNFGGARFAVFRMGN